MSTMAAQLDADLAALKATAERAGTSLACVFSSSCEFEADVIRTRRAEGAWTAQSRTANMLRVSVLTSLLVFAFLML